MRMRSVDHHLRISHGFRRDKIHTCRTSIGKFTPRNTRNESNEYIAAKRWWKTSISHCTTTNRWLRWRSWLFRELLILGIYRDRARNYADSRRQLGKFQLHVYLQALHINSENQRGVQRRSPGTQLASVALHKTVVVRLRPSATRSPIYMWWCVRPWYTPR